MPADRAPMDSHLLSSSHPAKPMMESLESRILMFRVDGSGTFEYLAGDDETIIRVAYQNVEAEFIFAAVDHNTNDLSLRTGFIVPPGEGDEERRGRDLYHVYVNDSDADSFISIARVPALDVSPRPMEPFADSIGDLRVRNAQNNELQLRGAPDATGQVLLGARTRDLEGSDADDEDAIPIVEKELDGDDLIGAIPEPDDGILRPGVTVANFNDFGRFLVGGTVMGNVVFTGSVDTFYAGWLLTGDATGIGETEEVDDNFLVAGDIRNLIVKSSIGTDTDTGDTEPGYLSGFVMVVGGRIGQVQAYDSIIGPIQAIHHPDAPQLRGQVEVELRTPNQGSFSVFQQGRLGPDSTFNNDSFATPQYVGTFANSDGKEIIRIDGTLQNDIGQIDDFADYYGLGLLAGETITVQLRGYSFQTGNETDSSGLLNIGIYDPDGRLIASDYDSVGAKIRIRADRPGVYRLAVAPAGDADFNGAAGEFGTDEVVASYRIRVQGGGDVAIGGIAAGGGIFDRSAGNAFGIFARRGDIGAIVAGARLTAQGRQNIYAQRGNLRAVEAGSVGAEIDGAFGFGPEIVLPRGSVGLLRSTGGALIFNQFSNALAIGGDFQVMESAGNFFANAIANGNIGVVRAAQMAWENARSFFKVNADGGRDPGVIDLIDVAGDLGTLSAGGPAIETGPRGNVRYINVGGDVYQDGFFGGGGGFETVLEEGERIDLVDDSGSDFRLTPIPRVFDPNWDPSNPFDDRFIDPGALTVSTYGIRDKGGVVLLNVTSTRGVQVDASGPSVEIASIVTTGTGGAIVDSLLNGGLRFATQNPRALDVLLRGSAIVDVLNITGGQFTSIINSTAGEIVSADITSVGELRARTLGFAKNNTAAAVNPIEQKSNVYPFLDQRNAISISGNAITIAADRQLGNLIVGGILQNLIANADGQNVSSVHEGINAPVQVTGELRDVQIGEGVLYSGSGNLAHAGIFAGGEIGRIRGSGADIRGDVISQSGIGEVSLSNGSIINTQVAVITEFADLREFGSGVVTPDNGLGTFADPFYELGEINLSGNGGIIGSQIFAHDIGPISVRNGFGILNSLFATPGIGQTAQITTDGYGVRATQFFAGANITGIRANGTGELLSTRNYSKSVRVSESSNIDPFFGFAPNAETDLHAFLGTSEDRHRIQNVSKSGVFEGLSVRASRNASTFNAHVVRGNSTFNIANRIDSFVSRSGVNRMSLRTGRLNDLRLGGDVRNADIGVAGPISEAVFNGDFEAASSISATGPDGIINSLDINGQATGEIRATVRIDNLDVAGRFNGILRIDGTTRDSTALGTFNIGSDFVNGSIDILGKVKQINVGRDFGKRGESVRIIGELESLVVARDFNADIRVRRDLGLLSVRNILSQSLITVDGDLDQLIVRRDIKEGAVINVGGTLGSRSIGGDNDGEIIVG